MSLRSLPLLALTFVAADAAINFSFNFGASVPAAARTAAQEAASHISDRITGPSNVTMDVDFRFANLGSGILGGASIDANDTGGNSFSSRSTGYHKALTGGDLNGSAADIDIEFGTGINWGYTTTISSSQFSFFDTVVHELIHSIGFAEGINLNGSDAYGGAGTSSSTGLYTLWDQYLGDASGGSIIDSMGVVDMTRWNAAVEGGTGVTPPATVAGSAGLYFYGPNAMAANGGQPVAVYSPTTYESGSSVGHFDTDAYGTDSNIMVSAGAAGDNLRALTPLDLAVMQDLGFTVVPEPTSAVMISLGAFAWARRRRR